MWTCTVHNVSLSVRRVRIEKNGLFTVGGLRVSLVKQRKRMTTRIVGYRSARCNDSNSRVKQEGAHYR